MRNVALSYIKKGTGNLITRYPVTIFRYFIRLMMKKKKGRKNKKRVYILSYKILFISETKSYCKSNNFALLVEKNLVLKLRKGRRLRQKHVKYKITTSITTTFTWNIRVNGGERRVVKKAFEKEILFFRS